jgi:hypothetical protein
MLKTARNKIHLATKIPAMPIASPRYAFISSSIVGAPPDPGVYVLWQGNEIIFFGYALRNESTIRLRLLEHMLRRCEPYEATHYSWEICRDVLKRLAELMGEYEANFKRLPRYNLALGGNRRDLP